MFFKLSMAVMVCAAVAMGLAVQVQAEERDPFVSILDLQLQNARADLSGINLKGIIWSANRPVAILNDTLVTEGDVFSGFKMAKIDKNNVTLTLGKETYVLSLEAPSTQNKLEEEQEQGQPSGLLAPPSPFENRPLGGDLPQELPR